MIDISVFFRDDEKDVRTDRYDDFAVVKLHDKSTTFKFFIRTPTRNTRQAREFAKQILAACDALDAPVVDADDEDLTAGTD